MTGLFQHARKWLYDDQGVTAVEYAVMLALMIVALIGAITALGGTTLEYFNTDVSEIGAALDGGA